MRLKNKIAVVTGAGSGFGEGIARRFVAEGARVVLNDIDAERGQRVSDELGEQAVFAAGDVSRDADWAQLVDTALDHFGGLQVLVNNAGYTHLNGPLLDVEEAEFDRVYAVNVKSLYHSARHVVPIFRKRGGGAIVNIASTAGARPRPGLTWYNGSKGAAITITRSMAVELAPDHIRVNAINPVIGETGLVERFMGKPDTPENRATFLAGIPLGRFSRPEDIAAAAVFLASDEACFVTGVALEVDGGRCV